MEEATRKQWARQDQHTGDRLRLFRVVRQAVDADQVLYPGSYVDIAASFSFRCVTYIDSDRRAAKFFRDHSGVQEIIADTDGAPTDPSVRFIHGDYRDDLGLADESFDLLISLYAGPVSDHCTRYLRIGGTLLVNASHGDAALASIDSRYQLIGVIRSSPGTYRVHTEGLDEYLVPAKPVELSAETIRSSGRGIGYTKPAFAYLFERTA